MAKDDYFVIIFRVLKYLYKQLKNGEPADPAMLRHDSKIFQVNERYWTYILSNMQEDGLIRGLRRDPDREEYEPLEDQLKDILITPKGIEMLCDSRMSEKVDNLLQGILKIG